MPCHVIPWIDKGVPLAWLGPCRCWALIACSKPVEGVNILKQGCQACPDTKPSSKNQEKYEKKIVEDKH